MEIVFKVLAFSCLIIQHEDAEDFVSKSDVFEAQSTPGLKT